MQSTNLKIKERKIIEEGIGQVAIHSALNLFTFILISPEQNNFILVNSK